MHSGRHPQSLGRSSPQNSHLHVPKAGRSRAVTGSHRLSRLTFATIGRAPHNPVLIVGDGVTRVPEIRRNAGVRAVLKQATAFSLFDFPADFGTELKIEPHVVDTPGAVGINKYPVIGIGDDVFKFPRTGL